VGYFPSQSEKALSEEAVWNFRKVLNLKSDLWKVHGLKQISQIALLTLKQNDLGFLEEAESSLGVSPFRS
jgi:hypothetical protein